MEIKDIFKITGQIVTVTGLHIGGSSDIIEIGMENPVIKNPITNEPYIPGSSLKGKMRMLLEWYLSKVTDGSVCDCSKPECPVCTIFGVSSDKSANIIGPTRIIVRDSFLDKSWRETTTEQGFMITESKTENSIDRITAAATRRQMERVPAGAKFNFEIIYKVFDMENEFNDEKYFDYVLLAMKLVELDYLGGGGSRGSGKIQFTGIKKSSSMSNSVKDLTLPEISELKEALRA
ncbi:MAG: type III-A CRISPR-associated RAMP protein Csm3 [Candidatus Humimicrobiaceae bacterium]